MPFWTFFSATLIGKGLIKVNVQAFVLITLFTDTYLNRFLAILELYTPKFISTFIPVIVDGLNKYRASFHKDNKHVESSSNTFAQLWSVVIFLLIGVFVCSAINQFAQQRVSRLDAEKLEKMKKQH